MNSGEYNCLTERRQPVGRVPQQPCLPDRQVCRGVSEQNNKKIPDRIGFPISFAAWNFNYGKVLLFFFLVAFYLPVQGQTIFKVNQYNVIYDGDLMPVITLYSNYSFNSKVGFSSYFYVNGYKKNSWGEGLIGPNWSPAKGISLAFLAGFQSNEKSLWRFSPVFNISKRKFSAFGGFEYGGKRHRWDVMSFYNMNKFKIGGELIRFYKMFAAGPRTEFTFLKKQPLTVFYSGLWDWQNKKYASMFGIYTTFGALK